MQATGWDTENQRGVIEREIERLRVRVNREPAVSIGLGNAPGCLDRSMLNRRRIPTAFNDQVGTRETLINVAEPHSAAVMSLVAEVAESLASNNCRSGLECLFHIEHGIERFGLALHPPPRH